MHNQEIPKQPLPYCYNNEAKLAHSRSIKRFYREAQKQLPGFTFKVHFNKGGIAVWGETYAKIYQSKIVAHTSPDTVITDLVPIVEAYDTSMGLLVRQWDGRNSGHNHYVQTLDQFVRLVQELASKPFVRF
jgi:hypothetical protein